MDHIHARRARGTHLDTAYLDRVHDYHGTEPYAEAMRKRQVWVEPLFAEAKAWHGLGHFRLRGLPKVNSEALLIAAGQNLKRLLSCWSWGRRPFPRGAGGVTRSTLSPVRDLTR
ncbi:MAG: transposase [Chloroflexota bacterium]|nr:transposase [Chloroflexota bacterium]